MKPKKVRRNAEHFAAASRVILRSIVRSAAGIRSAEFWIRNVTPAAAFYDDIATIRIASSDDRSVGRPPESYGYRGEPVGDNALIARPQLWNPPSGVPEWFLPVSCPRRGKQGVVRILPESRHSPVLQWTSSRIHSDFSPALGRLVDETFAHIQDSKSIVCGAIDQAAELEPIKIRKFIRRACIELGKRLYPAAQVLYFTSSTASSTGALALHESSMKLRARHRNEYPTDFSLQRGVGLAGLSLLDGELIRKPPGIPDTLVAEAERKFGLHSIERERWEPYEMRGGRWSDARMAVLVVPVRDCFLPNERWHGVLCVGRRPNREPGGARFHPCEEFAVRAAAERFAVEVAERRVADVLERAIGYTAILEELRSDAIEKLRTSLNREDRETRRFRAVAFLDTVTGLRGTSEHESWMRGLKGPRNGAHTEFAGGSGGDGHG